MILIGMGANLPSPVYGTPIDTLEACLDHFAARGLKVIKKSSWYESAPVPLSDQPWYINGVVQVETAFSARRLLKELLDLEETFGRVRAEQNAPRIIDLDLIAYHDEIREDPEPEWEKPFCVPHPRLHERAFVLLPIEEINPDWYHPKSFESLEKMIEQIPLGQTIRKVVP